jgi:hypothetical protein
MKTVYTCHAISIPPINYKSRFDDQICTKTRKEKGQPRRGISGMVLPMGSKIINYLNNISYQHYYRVQNVDWKSFLVAQK